MNVFALNNLGYSYYLAGDLERAESKFQEVLAKDPSNTLARNNLGLVWCRQGKDTKALTLWEKTEGEFAAREKLTQVLALLGKSVDTGARNLASEAGAKTAQIPAVPRRLLNKPGKDVQQPDGDRNRKNRQNQPTSIPA